MAGMDRRQTRRRVRYRIRKRVNGTAARPRVAVFRSLKHISVQAIDDQAGRTLVAASSQEKEFSAGGGGLAAAKIVGEALGERLKQAGVGQIVFDRGGFIYHGRVKALAEAVRSAGLKF
jgi:large subunit ribosomal protein L18